MHTGQVSFRNNQRAKKTHNSSDVNNFFPLNKERDRKDEGDVRISKYFNKESSGNFLKGYRNMKKAVWMVVIQNDIN